MPTIKDVAALSGMSISTVSRALSGNVPVSEETRQRVLEAVEKLNYRPNALAQGLKKGETNLIALIIPNIMNPIFPALARGVEDAARERGYNVFLCNTDENMMIEERYLSDLHKNWVDGYIFATACENSKHIMQLQESDVPVVLLIRDMAQKAERKFNSVMVNNVQGAYEMTQYLLRCGKRNIAVVKGDSDIMLYRERYEGYCRALTEAGLAPERELIVEADADGENVYDAVCNLLRSGRIPDAIFAMSDPYAISTMRAARDCGVKIPEQMAVTGFDNLAISAMLEPPLTTMSQPLYKMGVLAAKRLIEMIEDKSIRNGPPKQYVMNPKLIVRASG